MADLFTTQFPIHNLSGTALECSSNSLL